MRVLTPERVDDALVRSGSLSEASRRLGIDRKTLYRYLRSRKYMQYKSEREDAMRRIMHERVCAMLSKVLDTLAELLICDDPRIRLRACEIILRIPLPSGANSADEMLIVE